MWEVQEIEASDFKQKTAYEICACLVGSEMCIRDSYQGSVPKFASNLRIWGEAGTVKLEKQGKIIDRGVTMMFIGYANNHNGSCFRMFNPATNGVSKTRDVILFRRMFYEKQDAETTKKEPVVFWKRQELRKMRRFP